jgi:hypothetical protein
LIRNLEQLQLWLHNKHVQNKVPATMVETLGGPAATTDAQVSTIDLVTELQQGLSKNVNRTNYSKSEEVDELQHQLRALHERLPSSFYKIRVGRGGQPQVDDEILYGARFSTEIYTRGCYWIPRVFA